MTRLGPYRGEEVVKRFQGAGWRIALIHGSHIILEKEGSTATLSVPVHRGKNVTRGALRDLLKDARIEHRRIYHLCLNKCPDQYLS